MKVKIRKQGDVAIVTLPGRLVYGEREGILTEATDALLQEGFLRFLLDFEKVTFMDSSGLVELVGTYKRVVARGGVVKLVRANAKIRELLTITNLRESLPVFDDEEQALASFTVQAP